MLHIWVVTSCPHFFPRLSSLWHTSSPLLFSLTFSLSPWKLCSMVNTPSIASVFFLNTSCWLVSWVLCSSQDVSYHFQNELSKSLKILVLVILASNPALWISYMSKMGRGDPFQLCKNDSRNDTSVWEFRKKYRSNSRIPSVKDFNKGNKTYQSLYSTEEYKSGSTRDNLFLKQKILNCSPGSHWRY